MLRKMTLLTLSILILAAGCATTQSPMPPRPAKPVITAVEHEGMVCFDRGDAYLLFLYIVELEEGYDQ